MLSIIIITKDEEKHLPNLLESIRKQDYDGLFEVIVSDANSKDKTREIAEKYDCKIINGGLPSRGRNNGAKVAQGSLLLFLDADVVLPSDFLKKNISEFVERNLVAGTTVYVPLSKRRADRFLYTAYNLWAKITQTIYPHAGGFCIFCTKEVFGKVGGFDEKIVMGEDHAFVNKCSKQGKFRLLNGVPILCVIRRLNKEGRWKLIVKYVYLGAYRIFRGELYRPLYNYDMQGTNFKTEVKKNDV